MSAVSGGAGALPRRVSPLREVLLNVARVALLLTALGLLAVVRSGVSPAVYAAAIGVSISAVWLTARKASDFRLWAVYILGFVLFAHLRTLADETSVATHFQYPIDVDRAMFFGEVPTLWLQDKAYSYGETGPLEIFTMPVYLSYFVVPHIMAFIIWRLYPQRFPVYVAAILGAVYMGLLVSFLVPTAPPWLAGQTGELPHVARVLDDIGQSVSPGAYEQAYSTAGPNDVAAMPSLHTALPVVIAFAMWRTQRALAVAAIAYACAMGFSLVYLGEHYVADVMGGVAVAALSWWTASLVHRRLKERRGEAAESDAETTTGQPAEPHLH